LFNPRFYFEFILLDLIKKNLQTGNNMIYLVVDDKGQILVLKATGIKEGNDEAIEKMNVFVFFYQILFLLFWSLQKLKRICLDCDYIVEPKDYFIEGLMLFIIK
jgi:hypothetical protein